jgi:hypothetical protein
MCISFPRPTWSASRRARSDQAMFERLLLVIDSMVTRYGYTHIEAAQVLNYVASLYLEG